MKILHLEDSPRDAELIRERMTDEGLTMDVDWAANEKEFEAFLQQSDYDIILADYHVTGFDGPVSLQKAHSLRPGTPYICVSGAIGEDCVVELLRLGATDYVSKDRLARLPFVIRRAMSEASELKAHRQVAESLVESEKFFHSLFDNMLNSFAYCRMLFEDGKPQDFVYLTVNAAFESQTGLRNVAGKKVTEVIPSIRDLDPQLLEIFGRVAMAGQPERFEMFLKSMRMWFSISVYSPALEYFVAVFDSITERKNIEKALRESEERLRRAVFCAPLPIMVHAEDGQVILISDAWTEITGYSHAEIPTIADWTERAYGQRKQLVGEDIARLYGLTEKIKEGEYVIHTKSGSLITWEFMSAPLGSLPDGRRMVISMAMDVTEHERAEQALRDSLNEKESLLKEIHHRVKNNLQIVSSLLRLQSVQVDQPMAKAALMDMQNRVRSMALIHEHLYNSANLSQVDMAAYLKNLCSNLVRALTAQPDTIRLLLDLVPIRLEIDQAIPCGLLVNELVTNSLKHAFPEGRTGDVRVELHLVDSGGKIHLRVADSGIGLPANFDIKRLNSLGLNLASDLAQQLRGQLEMGPGPGTIFEAVFAPTNRVRSPRQPVDADTKGGK